MKLHLLEGRKNDGYVTFGSVWKKGEVKESDIMDGTQMFRLYNEEGNEIQVQSKTLAYWPDGSIKWSGHTADSRKMGTRVTLLSETVSEEGESQGEGRKKEDVCLKVTETDEVWKVSTGMISLEVPKMSKYCSKMGEPLLKELCLNGKVIAKEGYPVFRLEHRQKGENNTKITQEREYQGLIEQVTLEQSGPLQAVFCYRGMHVTGEEAGMPFVIRLFIGAGDCELKLVHTFLFDGEENRDYLKGMGIRFQMPMEGTPVNHHIQFVGENKVFHEAAVMLNCNHPKLPFEIYQRQMNGEYLEDEEDEKLKEARECVPVWNRYRLIQSSAYHFGIRKSTKEECCELTCRQGSRSKGAMAISSQQGGLMLGVRDFWQKYPGELEVENLGENEAKATVWFYSPAAEAYDFRHYDTKSYPRSCYEGFEEVGASAVGIGVTSECRVRLCEKIPKQEELLCFANWVQKPGVYVASPEQYHEKRAFGYWSLIAKNSDKERWLEEQLDRIFDFYKQEVENRDWYGLFDYGDVMHTYDTVRHTWRYDVGGMAWQNTELADTYWLWLYFMRTGREDVFTMAEAMSRHCSEVDIYHFGPLKGLGSRHNVRHWGCSCKEPRISMAGHHRFLYYLTGDERLGEVMEDVKDADLAMSNFPHGQAKMPDGTLHPAARSGPDWSSYVSNWMTHYERTLEEKYRKRIETGIKDIAGTPFGLISGPDYLYDPLDGHLIYNGESENTPNQHLQICMGGPQIWLETADMLEDDTLKKMLADLGSVYYLTPEERSKLTEGKVYKRPFSWPFMAAGVTAFSAFFKKDDALAHKTWDVLFKEMKEKTGEEGVTETAYGKPEAYNTCKEVFWIGTNTVAQWGLNVIMSLEFIRNDLEKQEVVCQTPLDYAKASCETMMRKFHAEDLPPKGHFHYHQGVFLSGVYQTYCLCKKEEYFDYIKSWVDSCINEDGTLKEFDPGQLDDIQPGILFYPLMDRVKKTDNSQMTAIEISDTNTTAYNRYKKILDTLMEIILKFPKNKEGGFWHKAWFPDQMWLDGLYMAGPICAEYGARFDRPEFFDIVAEQVLLMKEKTQDAKTGLLYHAYDSSRKENWSGPVTGHSSEFWGRSIGWVPVAVLNDLDFIPKDHPKRKELEEFAVSLLKALCCYQSKEGRWYQVVDKGECAGNWLENSCSCLYVAAIAKAVRKGLLSKEYLTHAKKGYEAVIHSLKWEGENLLVGDVCIGTGVGTYEYYCERPTSVNDLHGVGAFLIMCTEMQMLN